VVAAVIGAVVGSLGGAYLGVAIGADRDDERSDREFWRVQRISIYGDFLAAAEESRVLIEGYLLSAESATRIWDPLAEYPEPPADLLADIEEPMRRVDTLAEEMRQELVGARALIVYVNICHSDDTSHVQCDATVDEFLLLDAEHDLAENDWWSLRQFESDRDNFMQAAQEQLDAPD
jgi:hypothetical protein